MANYRCHKCPHNGKNDDYCWKYCTISDSASVSTNGKMVSLDKLPAPDEFLATASSSSTASVAPNVEDIDEVDSPQEIERRAVTNELRGEVEEALIIILANLMQMGDMELCIFRHIYNGENLQKIGDTLPRKMTKQAVAKYLKQMVRKYPTIGKVILQMKRTGAGGAKKTAPSINQLQLFN